MGHFTKAWSVHRSKPHHQVGLDLSIASCWKNQGRGRIFFFFLSQDQRKCSPLLLVLIFFFFSIGCRVATRRNRRKKQSNILLLLLLLFKGGGKIKSIKGYTTTVALCLFYFLFYFIFFSSLKINKTQATDPSPAIWDAFFSAWESLWHHDVQLRPPNSLSPLQVVRLRGE